MHIDFLKELLTDSSLEKGLELVSGRVDGKIVFSTSFGMEDQAISHAIFSQRLGNIETFTLDTGRLFPETYATWDRTVLQYGAKIKAYYPQADALETFINANGINAFYNSVELRKDCCGIRKVVPLNRALQGASIWITGLRAEQSPNRNDLQSIEWDDQYQLYKYNPLLNWTEEQVSAYITANAIPYNPLHDEGYVSIGCAPCTRAIETGEDFRAGRWWWEQNSKKECGLHK